MIIVNTSLSDGAAKGNPGLAGCVGIFRNHVSDMLYCFAEPLGAATSFQAELCAVMSAVEIAHKMN
ncbi:ribonuclease H [Trifolium pratense]|uniref:Ribonuclease H n=1 Tax=Trifolium pratense TaxID=57577 RepID=A0A2K3JPH4_TRIPR|nr:ribonuclease H [Trifolium pratense]